MYMWAERARSRCEVVVLVIATRKQVATWARQPIHNGASLTRVTVLAAEDFPRITDLHEARADLPFTALAAALRIRDLDRPVQYAAYLAIRGLPRPDTLLYISLIFRELDRSILLAQLEDLMELHPQEDDDTPTGPTFLEWLQQMRADARAAGQAEGQAAGQAEGQAEARKQVLLRQLSRRGIRVDADTGARIATCNDPDQLDLWLDGVFEIRHARDMFDP